MLTHDKLVELHQELATIPVLSVYLDGNQHDPAQRNAWRTELQHGLDEARRGLNLAGDEESKAFDLAARFVQGELQNFDGFLPDKAFVAFATADRLWYGETVSVRMPNLVRWERGISVAPYVRGLKQERPVVVALLDSQRARVFLYRDGGVEEVADLRADTFVGDLSDSGMSKRSSLSSGLRGETRTDAAHRVLQLASERLVKDLAGVVGQVAGEHGFVLLGGTPEMETVAQEALPKSFHGRAVIERSLHLEMPEAEVREAVGDAASELTKRWQSDLVQQVFDQARAEGLATMGSRETERALAELRVDMLLPSRTLTGDAPDEVDRLVGIAFAGGAHVEEVSGGAGERLDLESEGIAARLRFRIREPEDADAAG